MTVIQTRQREDFGAAYLRGRDSFMLLWYEKEWSCTPFSQWGGSRQCVPELESVGEGEAEPARRWNHSFRKERGRLFLEGIPSERVIGTHTHTLIHSHTATHSHTQPHTQSHTVTHTASHSRRESGPLGTREAPCLVHQCELGLSIRLSLCLPTPHLRPMLLNQCSK